MKLTNRRKVKTVAANGPFQATDVLGNFPVFCLRR
jgi:hypothetical protein